MTKMMPLLLQQKQQSLKFVVYFCREMINAVKTKEQFETEVLTDTEEPCSLIVWNDEVNTFEWVIETLVDVCHHTPEQAEQCAWLIHYKGKYAVKQGSFDELKPMCDAITDRGIGATVEVMA
jgi:ATP-dependent Clp protease adaptor protein ClpS